MSIDYSDDRYRELILKQARIHQQKKEAKNKKILAGDKKRCPRCGGIEFGIAHKYGDFGGPGIVILNCKGCDYYAWYRELI